MPTRLPWSSRVFNRVTNYPPLPCVQVVLVREKYIALAMLRLIEMEKSVVEGGGATGLAALMQGLLPELQVRHSYNSRKV